MEIIFVKQLSANATANKATIAMERELRAKGFWSTVSSIESSSNESSFCSPRLVVKQNGISEIYTDVAGLQKRLDIDHAGMNQPQAACW